MPKFKGLITPKQETIWLQSLIDSNERIIAIFEKLESSYERDEAIRRTRIENNKLKAEVLKINREGL